MTNDQKEKIKNMRQAGDSYSQITLTLSINKNTVKAYCRRNNLVANESAKPKTEKNIYTSCKQCEKPLTHGTKGQPKKFCSEDCRRLWWKANDSKHVKKLIMR